MFLHIGEDSSQFLPGWLGWLESPGKAALGWPALQSATLPSRGTRGNWQQRESSTDTAAFHDNDTCYLGKK